MKKKKRLSEESKFIVISGLIVVMLGTSSLYSIFAVPIKIVKIDSSGSNKDIERNPSSQIEITQEEKKQNGANLLSYKINCDENKEDFKANLNSNSVRISLIFCEENPKDISLNNKTNGFTAAIISLNNSEITANNSSVSKTTSNKTKNSQVLFFTSDYIALKEGANEFELTYLDKQNKSLKKIFNVFREPLAP